MKLRHWISATLISVFFGAQALSLSVPWYTDVEVNHVYRDAVWFMTQREYVHGYDDGTFRPLDPINRVEALTMILNSVEILPEATVNVDLNFPDVEEDAWYVDTLGDALSRGIVSGNDDGTFDPGGIVTRAAALKMITLANGIELPDSEGDWYQEYLDYGIEEALIVPIDYGDYQPGATLSRGELSDMIYRLIKHPFTGEVELGTGTYYADMFVGRGTANGETYSHEELTAAHPTLPFHTMLKVTNVHTNLSVEVRVNDRGPYAGDHIIDLTQSAFDTIGNLSSGILDLRIEILEE